MGEGRGEGEERGEGGEGTKEKRPLDLMQSKWGTHSSLCCGEMHDIWISKVSGGERRGGEKRREGRGERREGTKEKRLLDPMQSKWGTHSSLCCGEMHDIWM